MAKLIEISEKTKRVRDLFPCDAQNNIWYPLQNGYDGCMLDNGSIDLRRKVKLTSESAVNVWRIDRVTAKGNERFIGYRSLEIKHRPTPEDLSF